MVSRAPLEESRPAPIIIPLTRRHPLPDGEVTLLGAHASVTGVMTLAELGKRRVLIDCGRPEGTEGFEWQLDDAALGVDAVLLTHAHEDHVSALPDLVERGFRGPIYGTPATLAITRALLEDRQRMLGTSALESMLLLEEIQSLFRPVGYDRRQTVEGDIQFEFREAGHILGSASVDLISAQSRIIFSGDLGRPQSPLLRNYATTWRSGRPVDLVVMESTYGDEEHGQGLVEIEAELERILREALDRGGQIVVPAFAFGRAQTLLFHLTNLVESGRAAPVPVAIDSPPGFGITRDYRDLAPLFDRHALDDVARSSDPITYRDLCPARREGASQRLSIIPGPLLIIAGNGRCTNGRVVGHLRRLLPLEQSTVLLLGYQAEGTAGRAIQRAATRGGRVWLDYEEVRVRAHVETLSGLSAHADRVELAQWLRAIPNVTRVALHHGEPKAQRGFASWYA